MFESVEMMKSAIIYITLFNKKNDEHILMKFFLWFYLFCMKNQSKSQKVFNLLGKFLQISEAKDKNSIRMPMQSKKYVSI